MDFLIWGSSQKAKVGSGFYSAVGACQFSDVGLISCGKLPYNSGTRITHVPEPVPDKLKKPKVLHIATADPSEQIRMLEEFAPRKFASIDAHKSWLTAKENPLKKIRGDIDVLFLDLEEAMYLSKKKNPVEAAKSLVNGCSVVLKMGDKGCIIADSGDAWQLPAYMVKVSDLTGVGDIFAGAFMSYLSKRPSIIKAGAYATVVASMGIEKDGINKLLHTERKTVNKRYKEYLKNLNRI